jgi:hypothetical protein
MTKYSYNDIVTAKPNAPSELRPGERAWVVGISEQKDRKGEYLTKFPSGTVYLVEFEDGSSVSISESDLMTGKS